jgi:hypothetical protein
MLTPYEQIKRGFAGRTGFYAMALAIVKTSLVAVITIRKWI